MKIYLVFKCGNRIILDRDRDFDIDTWTAINRKVFDEIGVDWIGWKRI